MIKLGWVVALCCAYACACAGGDQSGTSGGRQQSPASRPPAQHDDDEPAGGAGSGSLGDLGNSDFDPAELDDMTPPPDAAAPECMPGMRCYDDSDPDETDCGSLTLESSVETIEHPGNVLVIADRSFSMADPWGNVARYEAARDAFAAATTELADQLTIGAVLFPSPDMDGASQGPCQGIEWIDWLGCLTRGLDQVATCEVHAITEADQIDFMAGPEFLTAFRQQFIPPQGARTPLVAGVQRAAEALSAATLTGATSVVIITDGAPNCSPDLNDDPSMIATSVSMQAAAWLGQGIRTHVIGLPGAEEAEMVLNQIAAAGGTGMYINPDDPATLEMRLREILSETIRTGIDSCTIDLMPPAEAPDKLHLVVTESGVDQDVPRELSADASWNITGDGATVTLEGRLCDDAQAGRFESLRFEFGCVDLPPLEPPPDPPPVE